MQEGTNTEVGGFPEAGTLAIGGCHLQVRAGVASPGSIPLLGHRTALSAQGPYSSLAATDVVIWAVGSYSF